MTSESDLSWCIAVSQFNRSQEPKDERTEDILGGKINSTTC